MRRFLILLVAMLALGAVSAPAASAINSDFPRGNDAPFPDTDAADWARVGINASSGDSCDVVYCAFEAVADGSWDWEGRMAPSSNKSYGWCYDAALEGSFSSGLLGVGVAGWASGSQPLGYFGFCYYLQPDASEMAGEVCAHVETGEVWVRQGIALDGSYSTYFGPGTTFGRVPGDGEELASIEFGGPGYVDTELGVQGGVDYDFKHRVEFDVTGAEGPYEVAVPEVQEESPCGWPELS